MDTVSSGRRPPPSWNWPDGQVRERTHFLGEVRSSAGGRSSRSPCRGNHKAVSPVIGTILMVAVTITLAGVLVYYIEDLPTDAGHIEAPMGATIHLTHDGNWTLEIIKGSTDNIEVQVQIINTLTGRSVLSADIYADSQYFHYNDNNLDGRLDASDTLLFNQTAGIVEPHLVVQIIKMGNMLVGPLEIP